MEASSIYSLTLSQLDEIEVNMTSPEGDALVQAASPADHQRTVKMLLDVHQARLALGNATLQSIADKLKANEKDIVDGTAAVKASLESSNNLAEVLNTVNGLIGTVRQIVLFV